MFILVIQCFEIILPLMTLCVQHPQFLEIEKVFSVMYRK